MSRSDTCYLLCCTDIASPRSLGIATVSGEAVGRRHQTLVTAPSRKARSIDIDELSHGHPRPTDQMGQVVLYGSLEQQDLVIATEQLEQGGNPITP